MNFNKNFYQIYPLGFCGAPKDNDENTVNRIAKVSEWIPHLKKLNINAVYFGPVFESDRHGYDTRDYSKIDCRLGSNEDFKNVCDNLHKSGISVVLDGVFNHVGRGFWAFKDVIEKKWDSQYKDWFYIDFGNNGNPDGFSYQNWEGHNELVKLNLSNENVINYLFSCIDNWIFEFGIDGIRLDVAYCLDREFLKKLHRHVKENNPDFFLLGEIINGDYNQICNDEMTDSATNYECRKGLFSSMNTNNLCEIGYSLNRQFGNENWCLYRGKKLLSFADNHDVDRLTSLLTDDRNLPLSYALLYAMPGIPCIYYGSEWGAKGTKQNGSDDELRACFDNPEWNPLCDYIAKLGEIRTEYLVLFEGDYTQLCCRNRQIIFKRSNGSEQMIFALNIDENDCEIGFNAGVGEALELLSGETHSFAQPSLLKAKSAAFWYSRY